MKKCLLIVDVQNDFLPGGALAVAGGNEVVEVINRMMGDFDLVVATQDWHPQDHGSFAASHDGVAEYEVGKLGDLDQCFWPVHCVAGTAGAEFASDLNASAIDFVVRKGEDLNIDSYSGFYDNGGLNSTGLTALLKENEVTEVYVTGLALDYCVKFTALDAVKEGFKTYLVPEACRAVNLEAGDDDGAVQVMEETGVVIKKLNIPDCVTIYRPVGVREYTKVEASEWKEWPARLPEQPIFYPVTNKEYACEIASQWNTKDKSNGEIGYVTEFDVKSEFLNKYPIKHVGAKHHLEYWIPAADVDEMNLNIVGQIRVIDKFT